MPSRWLVQHTNRRWEVDSLGQRLTFPSKIAALTEALSKAGAGDELEVQDRALTATIRSPDSGVARSTEVVTTGLRPPEPHRRTARNIRFFATHPEDVNARLAELLREASAETLVQRSGIVITLVALFLQWRQGRKWWVVALTAAGLQAWSELTGRGPALEFLRHRGFRHRADIEAERLSLRAIRGDFALFNHLKDPAERARRCIQLLT